MSDVPVAPVLRKNRPAELWYNKMFMVLSLILLVGGGFAAGAGFLGVLWLLTKWVLAIFAIAGIFAVSKAKGKGAITTLHASIFIAALVVFAFH